MLVRVAVFELDDDKPLGVFEYLAVPAIGSQLMINDGVWKAYTVLSSVHWPQREFVDATVATYVRFEGIGRP